MNTIECLKRVRSDESLRMQILSAELLDVGVACGDGRPSVFVQSAEYMTMEDFIDDEEVVITISHNSYVRRTPLTEYRRQGRGGKSSIGSNTRDEDFTEHSITATAHNYMLLFTEAGR